MPQAFHCRLSRHCTGLVLAAALLAGCSDPLIVSPSGHNAYEVSVATSGTLTAIAWYGGSREPDGIYFQWLTQDAKPRSSPVRVSDTRRRGYEPDLQLLGGKPVLAWYEKDEAGALTAWLGGLDRAGAPVWHVRLNGTGGWARNPVVRVEGDHLHVAWIEALGGGEGTPIIWHQRFSADGRALSRPAQLASASSNSWNLNAAVDPRGRFYVAYDAHEDRRANELHLIEVDGEAVHRIKLTADDGSPSLYPDIDFSASGEAAITWFDRRDGNNEIYVAVIPPSELMRQPIARPIRVTHTPADSIGAYLAWRGTRFTIAWCDKQTGKYELYTASFDTAGKQVAPTKQVSQARGNAGVPSIRSTGMGSVIGWNDYARVAGRHDKRLFSTAMAVRVD